MNHIADILSRKPFFHTPKVNKAEHIVDYVVLSSVLTVFIFHEI